MHLNTLVVSGNELEGRLPDGLSRLGALRALYLEVAIHLTHRAHM